MCIGFKDSDDITSDWCTVIFAIALDVFAFCSNVWFGIGFLILSIIILVTLNVNQSFYHTYTCVACIVLFNIGTAIWGKLDILLYVLPSLIAIFLALWRAHYGFVDNYFLSKLSLDEQIKIAEERYNGSYRLDYERKLKQRRAKKESLIAESNAERVRQEQIRQQQEFRNVAYTGTQLDAEETNC